MGTSVSIPLSERESSVLSERESTVLLLVACGYTNKEIARRLGLSVKTVEAHKANGMRKLQVTGRATLVRLAVEWGWLTLEKAPDPDTDILAARAGGSRNSVAESDEF